MSTQHADRNEFLRSVRNGAVIGALVLMVAVPWIRSGDPPPPPSMPAVVPAPTPATASSPAPRAAWPLPDFGDETPSPDALHVANWVFFTGDHQGKAVVILDKKAALVYQFDPRGQLVAATPALLGEAIGDDAAPGIGDKPLAQIRPHEKTTHAGRFEARPGLNADGEDVVWIDYDAALSMHRVRPTVAAERRLERLASPSAEDNRISYGCVNLPVPFYEQVLSPAVKKTGAVVYVLPETRSPQEVFGSWDVTDPQAVPKTAVARGLASQPTSTPAARRNREQ